MSALPTGYGLQGTMYQGQPWEGRRELAPQAATRDGRGSMFDIASLVAVGLVIAAGIYFAPDLQRYLKMRRM